jgi:pyruvate/2-oxoglutarate dehydrogenase complex dihydrolipoamide dehydrogenase (E3) component/cytochrome b561
MLAQRQQFAALSRLLHWVMAAMILTMLFIGVSMVASLANYHVLVSIHRPLGIAILVLVVVRFVNRHLSTLPPFPATMSPRERLAATASELAMYTLMFVLPLVGWGMLSAARYPIVLYGSLHLPFIFPHNLALYAMLRKAHTILAYLFFLTVLAHFGAILFHTLIVRDGILRRMAPWNIGPQEASPADYSQLQQGGGHEAVSQSGKEGGYMNRIEALGSTQSSVSSQENISGPKEYDFVVVGSGEASKHITWTLAKQGKRVAVIERKYIGGSCPNIACLPSKNVIHSAKVASYFRRSEEFGITKDGFKISMSGVRDRKRKMVDGEVEFHLAAFKSSAAELIMGSARFIAPKTLQVALADGGTRVVRGDKVVIGIGTHAKIDSIPGLSESGPLTHIEALELDHIPEHLLVLGGGYVGLELAQAMRRFGSRVTIIERNDRLAHREDEDVCQALHDLFRDEGIEFVMSSKVTRVEGKSGQSVKLQLVQGGSERVLEGTHVLVATGRTPNTSGIGLELAGVELTDRGYIKVNERLETTAPGVWAVGECAGSPQFTHIAFDDFRVIRDNLAGGHRVTTGRQVPFCLFTDPEMARVGLSETEAKTKGIAYRLAKVPMDAVLRTHTLSETRGFLKALIDTESDRILGFTGFGVGAGEIMASVQVAMVAGLPYTALRDAILTHPTLPEGLVPLFSSVAQVSRAAESHA